KIARLLAAQNAIHIGGGATIEVYPVDSVGKQTAVSDKLRLEIHHGHVVSRRRYYDPRPRRDYECIRHVDDAASRPAPKGDDSRVDLCVAMNGRNDWLDPE